MTIKFLVKPTEGMPFEEVSPSLCHQITMALSRLAQYDTTHVGLFDEVICQVNGKRVMTNHFDSVLSLALKLEIDLILAKED